MPLLLVCENNHLAGNVTPEKYMPPGIMPWNRAAAYGIKVGSVGGNSIHGVLEAAANAVNFVRSKLQPYLLDCSTYRLGKHKQGQGDLRSKDEIAKMWDQDFSRKVDFSRDWWARIEAKVDDVIARARAMRDASAPAAV